MVFYHGFYHCFSKQSIVYGINPYHSYTSTTAMNLRAVKHYDTNLSGISPVKNRHKTRRFWNIVPLTIHTCLQLFQVYVQYLFFNMYILSIFMFNKYVCSSIFINIYTWFGSENRLPQTSIADCFESTRPRTRSTWSRPRSQISPGCQTTSASWWELGTIIGDIITEEKTGFWKKTYNFVGSWCARYICLIVMSYYLHFKVRFMCIPIL